MGFAVIPKVPHMCRQYPLETSLNDLTTPALPQPQDQSTPPNLFSEIRSSGARNLLLQVIRDSRNPQIIPVQGELRQPWSFLVKMQGGSRVKAQPAFT